MSYGSNATRYLETDVLSRSREWLVPLLFEHLRVSLARAEVQIQAGDMPGKATSLSRASQIVLELAGTLDHERGGPLAGQLAALYAFFATTILDVGRTLDLDVLRRLISMVTELHEAWTGAAEQVCPRTGAGGSPLPPAGA